MGDDYQPSLFDTAVMPTLEPRTHARRSDPDTSRAAARELSDRATMMRRLLRAYAVRPMTAEEAASACGYTAESGAWKRVSDLALHGFIEDTGARRPGHSGRAQMVRQITLEGVRALS